MAHIPKPVPLSAMKEVVLNEADYHLKEIIDYVEWQSNKGRKKIKVKVVHLEKMKSEVVFSREHVAWDVHTNEPGRWWVITEPTNLYSQSEFPSLDYTLSFHIGVTARVASRDQKKAPQDSKDRLLASWRRWENAADSIETAKESEDFQSVGMMCRETLIELIKDLQPSLKIDSKEDYPKASDFANWATLIAKHYAAGERNSYIRGYLISLSKETWPLVNWVTHTTHANFYEATLALDATANYLRAVARVVTNHEAKAPETCPKCKSYRIQSVFEPELNLEPPYVNVCEACGWNDYEEQE